MAEQSPSEQSIFLAAVEKPSAAERAAYLDRICAGDTALRGEVEALLAAHERLPAGCAATGQELALDPPTFLTPPGTLIGRYKVLEPIGEGGYGTVFMAEQTSPVHRKVALKIIKAGMDTRQVIARFEAERQALALMDHPNIAKVFDAGMTDTGRPFFVMELVKGVPITKYCDEHRLTPKQRLELFVQVCQAVQHAHQKGIIHRDLKPTNVLVAQYDGTPVPKVIDFGVAKAAGQQLTERTMFTGFGDVIGTPQYMSPEQAELNQLDVDTRSDIYSLGVLLYELLTGTTPLEGKRVREAALLEILRVIREEVPPRPSTRLTTTAELPSIAAQRGLEPKGLSGVVKGELDWIVMKALEKDRSRRYETANGLARDVERYLHDEPVAACPPSAGYRLRKFARRNKAALVMVSVVTLAVLLVVGSLGWMMRDRSAREEQIARDRATRQAALKERVTLALEEARTRHQEGRWREALDAAKRAEALAAGGESDEQTRQRAREMLADMQMLANLEDARVNSTRTEAGYDLPAQDRGTARAFQEYGIDIDALDRDAAATRIRARPIHFELAVFLDNWSHVRRRLALRGSKPIGKDWKELLEVARAADPDPWRDQLRKAVLTDDKNALIQLIEAAPVSSLPAETVDRIGDALMRAGATKDAVAFLKKGQRHHPQDHWINHNLGIGLARLGQQEEAIRYYTAAVALRPESGAARGNLGTALLADKDLDEAVAVYRKAVELAPKNAMLYSYLGSALLARKEVAEAVAVSRKAVELDPSNADAHAFLGYALLAQKELDEAVAVFRKGIELDPNNANAYINLAIALQRQKKLPEAIAAEEKAIAIDPKSAPSHNMLAWLLATCADVQFRDPSRALALAKKAVELDPKNRTYLNTLGTAYYRTRDFEASVAAFEKSMELHQGGDSFDWFFLAMAQWQLGNHDAAHEWYEKAVDWMEKRKPNHAELIRFRAEAAELLGVNESK